MKVSFLHPDFGVGGAERLILDAAIALDNNGHEVEVITNQFSEDHCFSESLKFKNRIIVTAKWVPRTLFGRFYALLAYIKLCIAAVYVIFDCTADVVFIDQISLPLFLFKLARPVYCPKLIFYCHFPDQKLAKHDGVLKGIYRYFIDGLENKTLGLADKIYVNSLFTKAVCTKTFSTVDPARFVVLYPSVNTNILDQTEDLELHIPNHFEFIFMSLNRYEGKKNHLLALEVFKRFRDTVESSTFKRCVLVFAGGYDTLNPENKKVFDELLEKTKQFGLEGNVKFYKSPGDAMKISLLRKANLLFYTPKEEHFGIVPLESMWLETPVMALRSGGPIETVDDQKTGFLVDPDSNLNKFVEIFIKAVEQPELLKAMGKTGRQRVGNNFSFEAFTQRLLETAL